MAQNPTSKAHSKQIEAGTVGRKKGHRFEALLAAEINKLNGTVFTPTNNTSHLLQGNPAQNLLQYISNNQNIVIKSVKASWLGGLATSGLGDAITDDNTVFTKVHIKTRILYTWHQDLVSYNFSVVGKKFILPNCNSI